MGIKTIVLGQGSVRILFAGLCNTKGMSGVQGLRKVFRCFAAIFRWKAARLAAQPATTLPTHARPVQMQTFLRRFPPKKGSTNIACEGRRRNLFYLFNPCLHSFHVQASKKTRKKWKQFLSQFCYCLQNNIYEEEIFISSEAAFFIFCLAFRSSPIPEPKKLSCLLRRKTNFLKNIYSAQASIHTLYICVIVVLFRQYIRRSLLLGRRAREGERTRKLNEIRDDSRFRYTRRYNFNRRLMQNSRNIKETAQALLNNQFIFGLYIWGLVRQLGAVNSFIGGFVRVQCC